MGLEPTGRKQSGRRAGGLWDRSRGAEVTARSSRALDVLFLTALPPYPSGIATMSAQLLAGLRRLGHRVRSLAPITPATLREDNALGVTRFTVPHFELADCPLSRVAREREGREIRRGLEALIAAERPHLLVTGREMYARHVDGVARSHGIPWVLIAHGYPTWNILNGTYPRALAARFFGHCRRAALIITPATHWAARLRRSGLPGVVSIPNPVDLRRFSPGPWSAALRQMLRVRPDDTVVLHASNLQTVKRPLDLVASSQAVLAHQPRTVYVILGDGPHRRAMETECRRLGVGDHFRFPGWVIHERMPDYLRLADLVLVPSELELQAMVYLEAQACGKTILASDVPGAREVITDGETGLLFRMGDVGELAARTLEALRDPAGWKAIGQRARVRVRVHAADRIARRYAASFAAVVRRHGRP